MISTVGICMWRGKKNIEFHEWAWLSPHTISPPF
jgi:hypothetical protein